jgi:hypothetical protein
MDAAAAEHWIAHRGVQHTANEVDDCKMTSEWLHIAHKKLWAREREMFITMTTSTKTI